MPLGSEKHTTLRALLPSVPKDSKDYEYIDAPSQLAAHRRDMARQKEISAQLAEMTAEQFAESVKANPGNAAAARASAEEAERQRSNATDMHKIAGTSPEAFASDVLEQFENRLQGLESTHLIAAERADHPGLYDITSEQATWDLTVAENGLKVLRARRDALKATPTE